MTDREKAIDFLECRRAYYASLSTDPNPHVKTTKVCGYTLAESANACLMAIKALKQDCISRTDMLDAIGHGTTYTSEDLQKIIENLPSANRECGVKMSEMPICSSNFIQLKQDVLNNKQLWRKLREIEDEDSD